jgi:monooxygenase
MELSSGYVRRAIDQFPRQATTDPWYRQQSYPRDRRTVMRSTFDDPVLDFARSSPAARTPSKITA